MANTYSVYRRSDDMPIVISGTAKQCARAMGITIGSFYTIFTKMKNGCEKVSRRWEIIKDKEEICSD